MPVEIIWLEVHHPSLRNPVLGGFGLLDSPAAKWAVRFNSDWDCIPDSEERAVLEGIEEFLAPLDATTALQVLSESSNVIRCTNRLEVLSKTPFEDLLEHLSALLLKRNSKTETRSETSSADQVDE